LTIAVSTNSSSDGRLTTLTFAPIASLAFIFGWLGPWRKHLARSLFFIVLLAFGLLSIFACGSGGGSSGGDGQNPPPIQTTSSVTVTASSGSLSHVATLTLTVN
jgi:hypothetical protein